jgi:hypothetical protein
MSNSFLDDSYLGGLGNSDITVAPTVSAEQSQLPTTRPDVVTLPGGISMPKQTFYVIALVVIAAAVYCMTKRKNKTE